MALEFSHDSEFIWKTFSKPETLNIIQDKWGLKYLQWDCYSIKGQLSRSFDPLTFLTQFFSQARLYTKPITSIDFKILSTNIISPSFWKRLWTDRPLITSPSACHSIKKCLDKNVNGIWITDCLQSAILDEESEYYDRFSDETRKEVIYLLMKLLVIGGDYNQFEDEWNVYEPIITSLYRDVIGQSVVKTESGAVQIIARSFLINKINTDNLIADYDRSICLVVVDVIGKFVKLLRYKVSI